MKDRHAWRLIHASRFHSNEPVLDNIYPPYSVLSSDLIQAIQKRSRRKRLAIYRGRHSRFKFDLDISRLIGRVFRRASENKNLLWRLRPRVFENPTLVTYVHQVAIHRVRLFFCRSDRNLVLLGISDQIRARLERPFAPGSDHSNVGIERVVSQLEPNLIVSLPGRSLRNRARAFLVRDLDMPLRDQRPRKRCSHQIYAFVHRVGFERSKHKIADELFTQVLDIELRGACCESLFFEPAEFFGLADVRRKADHFAVVSLLQPPEDDRSIEPSRIREHDLIYFF